MKKVILLSLVLGAIVTASGCTLSPSGEDSGSIKETGNLIGDDLMSNRKAVFDTNKGIFKIELFEDKAPKTTGNFISLIEKGFYDGLIFHRVIEGFMIQGGDPNSKSEDKSQHGMGGPGYTVKAEFNKNPHKRGTLSMARSAHPDSAGSQFFICVSDTPSLDEKYTVFGEVTMGMDVVDKIVSQPRDARDNPLKRVEIKVEIIGHKGG